MSFVKAFALISCSGLIALDPSHEYNSGRRRHEPAAPVPQQQTRPQPPPYHQQRPPPMQPGAWPNQQNHHNPQFVNSMGRPAPNVYGNYPPRPSHGYPPGSFAQNHRLPHQAYPNINQPPFIRPTPPLPSPGGPRLGVPPPPFALAGRPPPRIDTPPPPFTLKGQSVAPPFYAPTGPSGNKRGPPAFADDAPRDGKRRRGEDELPYE